MLYFEVMETKKPKTPFSHFGKLQNTRNFFIINSLDSFPGRLGKAQTRLEKNLSILENTRKNGARPHHYFAAISARN